MNAKLRHSLLFVLLAVTSQGARAADCEAAAAKVRHGEYRWTEGALIVQGTAAPNLKMDNLAQIKYLTQRAATADAFRKAATILAGVNVTPTLSARDIPGATSRVDAVIKGAEVCKTKFYSDGGVDVAIEVPLAGAASAIGGKGIGINPAQAESEIDGLILDARHLDFLPAMFPRLMSPDGQVLFDASRLDSGIARRRMPISYRLEPPGVPEDMTIVEMRALSLGSESPSDLVLGAADAARLEGGPDFLARGNVFVLIRSPALTECKTDSDDVEGVVVDWERRLLLVRGHGQADFDAEQDEAVRMRLMERAAEVDAERQLFVSARQALGLAGDDKTEGQLVNSVRCGAKFFRDGKAEVVLAAPFYGLDVEVDWADPREDQVAADDAPVTGVIIDASAVTAFEPSLAPLIRDGEAQTIYGPQFVSRTYGTVRGGASYHASVEAASETVRVGDNPVVIEASGVDPDSPDTLLLEAEAVEMLQENPKVLRSAAVAIVLPAEKIRQ